MGFPPSGGGTPSGPAGGTLSGTFPNPHLAAQLIDRVSRDAIGGWGDTGSYLHMGRATSIPGGLLAVAELRGNAVGTRTVSDRTNALRAVVTDAATVVTKQITGAVNNGSGLVRITCVAHGFSTGNYVGVYAVGGTTEANGWWIVTVIDANTFDLQGSAFVHAFSQLTTTATGVNAINSNTVNVGSTAGFPQPYGTFWLGGVPTSYAGLTATSFTKCTAHAATTGGETITGGTATNRPMLYGVSVTVNPSVDRGGLTGVAANGDDVGCFIGYNGGTGRATDAFYLGRNSTNFPNTPEWLYGYSTSAYVQGHAFGGDGRMAAGGAFFDASKATYDDATPIPLRIPNNGAIVGVSTAGTDVPLALLNASNTVLLGDTTTPTTLQGTSVTVPNGVAATDAAAFGQLVAAPVTFTGSGTWTPSANGQQIFAALLVGGGGGGGQGGSATGGSGGGGGQVLNSVYLGNVTTPQTVTIGAAGTGSTGANATAGGNTSIGTLAVAAGGNKGTDASTSGVAGGNSSGGAGVGTGGAGAATSTAGTTAQGGLNNLGCGAGGGGGPTSANGGAAGARSGANAHAGGTGASLGGGGGASGTAAGGNGSAGQGGTGANGGAGNTGNGGGGGGAGTAGGNGGNGDSGYVVIFQIA